MTLKKANPDFPILIRECSGVQPRLWARYGETMLQLVFLKVCLACTLSTFVIFCWPLTFPLGPSFAGFGKENSVALDNMNADQVAKAIETAANAKP